MNADEAICYMKCGGWNCVTTDREPKNFFRMYRDNDIVQELESNLPCAAKILEEYTLDEFISNGFRIDFEKYKSSR